MTLIIEDYLYFIDIQHLLVVCSNNNLLINIISIYINIIYFYKLIEN